MTMREELEIALLRLTPVGEEVPLFSYRDREGNLHVSNVQTYTSHIGAFPSVLSLAEEEHLAISPGLMDTYLDLQDLFSMTEVVERLGKQNSQNRFEVRLVRLIVSSFFRAMFSVIDHVADSLLVAYTPNIVEATQEESPHLVTFVSSQLNKRETRTFQFLTNQLNEGQLVAATFDQRLQQLVQSNGVLSMLLEIRRWLNSGGRTHYDVVIEENQPFFRIYKLNDKFLFSEGEFPDAYYLGRNPSYLNFVLAGGNLLGRLLFALDIVGDVLMDKLDLNRNISRHIGFGHNEARRWMQEAFDALAEE